MANKFSNVATVENTPKGWAIIHVMTQGDLEATRTIIVGCEEMCNARANTFNRTRQHGKSGLNKIGELACPNNFVKFA